MAKNDIFKKFDEKFNSKELAAQVAEREKSGGDKDFPEIPAGKYEVKVDSIELVESKAGDPMVKIVFTIVAGELKNQKLFMYQLLRDYNGIHFSNEFLRSLDSSVEVKGFSTYSKYADLCLDVYEGIHKQKLEYVLELKLEEGKDGKVYNRYSILEILETQ